MSKPRSFISRSTAGSESALIFFCLDPASWTSASSSSTTGIGSPRTEMRPPLATCTRGGSTRTCCGCACCCKTLVSGRAAVKMLRTVCWTMDATISGVNDGNVSSVCFTAKPTCLASSCGLEGATASDAPPRIREMLLGIDASGGAGATEGTMAFCVAEGADHAESIVAFEIHCNAAGFDRVSIHKAKITSTNTTPTHNQRHFETDGATGLGASTSLYGTKTLSNASILFELAWTASNHLMRTHVGCVHVSLICRHLNEI